MKKVDKPNVVLSIVVGAMVSIVMPSIWCWLDRILFGLTEEWPSDSTLMKWSVFLFPFAACMAYNSMKEDYASYIDDKTREDKKIELMESINNKIKDESDENRRLTWAREYDKLLETVEKN